MFWTAISTGGCVYTCLPERFYGFKLLKLNNLNGGPPGNRTPNQWIKSPLLYLIELTAHFLSACVSEAGDGVDDGTRTHDDRNHNPGLYQLSYTHQRVIDALYDRSVLYDGLARPAGLEPATLGLAYHYCFHSHREITGVCGLDYLFTVSGAARIVSTEPYDAQRKTSHFPSRSFSRTLPSASNSGCQRPVCRTHCNTDSINLSLQVP